MNTESELILPIVHMNGTSRKALIDSRCEVHKALRGVIEAMKQNAPNGRDYYPVPGLLDKAQEQHFRRMRMIQDLIDEFETEATELYKQGK